MLAKNNKLFQIRVGGRLLLLALKYYTALKPVLSLAKFVLKYIQFVDWGQTALAIQKTETKLDIYMKLFLRGFPTDRQTG